MRAITCPHGIKPKTKCKQCLKIQKAASYQRTKDHVLAHMQEYRQQNLAERQAYDRCHYQETKFTTRKEYLEKNRERERARDRKRQQKPERIAWRRPYNRMQNHKRRALGEITVKTWNSILKSYKHKCVYCGSKENLELEHLLPVSKGGTNARKNLAPACSTCNRKKGNKTVYEFTGRNYVTAT